MHRTARRLFLAVALLMAAALLPTAAAADCNTSALDCDWTGSDTYPIPMEVKQFTALVDLRDDNEGLSLEIYERIVADLGFEMPGEPIVALWAVEVDIPSRQLEAMPFPTSIRWMEGAISLRVRNGDEEGWSHLSMPTNSDFAYDLGREAGMPKYMGTMTISETAGGWETTTSVGEVEASRYVFTADADAEVGDDSLLRGWALHRDPYLHANPVFEGPSRTRVKYTALPLAPADWALGGVLPGEAALAPVSAITAPQSGTITYEIHGDLDEVHALSGATTSSTSMPTLFTEDESLADLVELSGTVTGEFLESMHHLLIQTTSID